VPKHILSVSYDPSLLSTREMLLTRRGYQVTSALGFTAALEACQASYFDLLIMGHSIPQKDKLHLVAVFREKCSAPILALQRYGEATLPGVDAHAYPDDVETLLSTVQTILNNARKDQKKN
jgi:DNA-binding response OmpR family regulator